MIKFGVRSLELGAKGPLTHRPSGVARTLWFNAKHEIRNANGPNPKGACL